jgi:hypothetical protein
LADWDRSRADSPLGDFFARAAVPADCPVDSLPDGCLMAVDSEGYQFQPAGCCELPEAVPAGFLAGSLLAAHWADWAGYSARHSAGHCGCQAAVPAGSAPVDWLPVAYLVPAHGWSAQVLRDARCDPVAEPADFRADLLQAGYSERADFQDAAPARDSRSAARPLPGPDWVIGWPLALHRLPLRAALS